MSTRGCAAIMLSLALVAIGYFGASPSLHTSVNLKPFARTFTPSRFRSFAPRRSKLCQSAVENKEFMVDTPKRAAELLNGGAVGVIPTDTSYAFVTKLSNREGVERMLKLKMVDAAVVDEDEEQWQRTWKKDMSLLCKDIQQIQHHTDPLSDRDFKILKRSLPGPYTFILPTTNKLPKFVIEHNDRKRTWKRRQVGVRIPDNEYLFEVLNNVDEPLVSNIPLSSFFLSLLSQLTCMNS
ncbi:hypothetical protein AAMO2058_000236600 [Amorphochlora amoebiformis]